MADKKEIIKEKYGEIVEEDRGCGCGSSCCGNENAEEISENVGYSKEEIKKGGGANLGLGCGNPVAMAALEKGDVVVDLGSGAGFDCFLAAERVGKQGKVIGIDMTKEMIQKARKNKEKRNLENVEFILAEIEDIPLEEKSVDKIISNCVINLSPDKGKVFAEAYRILKKDGEMYLSDIVLLEELSEEQRNDEDLLAGCVARALLRENYLSKVKEQGFKIEILSENKQISKEQYDGIDLESITIKATKFWSFLKS